MSKSLVCIVCPMGCRLEITSAGDALEVAGNKCEKGIKYARDEITNPVRMVCTTVKIIGGIHSVVPVKTNVPIPEKYKFDVIKAVSGITLQSPVFMGDVIIADMFGTGVDIVATRDM